MNKYNKPELLAPAGDMEKLKIAFAYGADAVYAGVPDFGMRVREIGFDLNSLAEGIKYTHNIGKKIYVTVNIFAHNDDLKKLPVFIKKIARMKPDALIVADPGVIGVVKDLKIDIPLHLSTQANVTNWRSVKWWHDSIGAERVILARELSYEEIKKIHQKYPEINLEMFVHGAMCMSYSGRCNISNYLTNRDPNKGDCSHCCRWEYNVYLEEVNRPGEYMKVEQDGRGSYFFNSRDLCLVGVLDDVIKSGVVSLKIEGRNKSVFYLAQVVKVYREALDLYFENVNKYKKRIGYFYRELQSITQRGYTAGFFGKDGAKMVNIEQRSKKECKVFVGVILGTYGKLIKIQARNQIKIGDKLDVMSPMHTFKIDDLKFLDNKGKSLGNVVNTNAIFYIKSKNCLPDGSLIRKENDSDII